MRNLFNPRTAFLLGVVAAVAMATFAIVGVMFVAAGNLNDWMIANGIPRGGSTLLTGVAVIFFFIVLVCGAEFVINCRKREMEKEERGE